MLAMSREPSSDYKIQFPSIAELKDGLASLTNRIARRAKFRGRKMRPGPMMNALLVYFMTLPEDEQARIIEEGLKRYEALLAFDDPQDDLLSVPPDCGEPSDKGVVFLGGSVCRVGSKPKRKDKPPKSK
jgi:hypothetical protein